MPNPYCTGAEIVSLMPDNQWSTSYDALFDALATRASRLIDRIIKKRAGYFAVDADETFYFDGSGNVEQWIGELAAAPTSVLVAETGDVDHAGGTGGTYTAWAQSDYYCWPYNALAEGHPFRRLDADQLNGSKSVWYKFRRGVKVVGKFGYSVTPPDEVKQAAITQSIRWFKRGQQGFQDVGAITDLGQLRYVKTLDPDIEVVILEFVEMTV